MSSTKLDTVIMISLTQSPMSSTKIFKVSLDQGGNIDDFLYTYTNIAKPGSIGAFTDRLLKVLKKAPSSLRELLAEQNLVPVFLCSTLAPTIAGLLLVDSPAMTTGEEG